MLQLHTTRSHLSPNDAISWQASEPTSFATSYDRPLYSPRGIRIDGAKVNQSIAFRRASLAKSPDTMAYNTPAIPRLTRTPWELERYKRNSVWKRTSHEVQLSHHVFRNLPREVYDCILKWLELSHSENHRQCPSCYLGDLCSLALTSRAWNRAATIQMYRRVQVLSYEDGCRLPKLRIPGTSRLKLLRRTLREQTTLAEAVREIHLPDLQGLYLYATIEREEIHNLAASLIMACPNLERLVGFHIPYAHSFDRLSHALSTRPNLKERLWVITDAQVEDDEYDDDPIRGYYHAACDPTEQFLELNAHHPYVSTLVLHQESTRPAIDLTYRAVMGTIRQLPLLRHLSLSGLSSSSFSNLALSALPPDLQSLRLENLPGINDKGLQRLSTSHAVISLKSLALIDMDMSDLGALAGFLSPHSQLLERFTFSQHTAPSQHACSEDPVFRSETLKYIHWELRSQAGQPPPVLSSFASEPYCPTSNDETTVCLATIVLAESIQDGLLPSLRRIRAPHDPNGVLQALCKPLSTALLRSDSSFLTIPPKSDRTLGWPTLIGSKAAATCSMQEFLSTMPGERADSVMLSASSTTFANFLQDNPLASPNTPAHSRLAAQARILAARESPCVLVRVTDPEDNVRLETNIGGFLGDLSSNIVYDLKSDRNRAAMEDEDHVHEWITDIDDILGEWEMAGPSTQCRHAASGNTAKYAVEVNDLF